MPLADAGVRAEVIRFAGETFKSALNADIIRPDSKAAEEDRRRGGEVEKHHIAVGLATTAFLNSFGADKVLGASAPQMLLGVARPNPACPGACSTTCGTRCRARSGTCATRVGATGSPPSRTSTR